MAVAGCVAIEVAEAILTVRAGGSEQHAQEHHLAPCHPTIRTVLDSPAHFDHAVYDLYRSERLSKRLWAPIVLSMHNVVYENRRWFVPV